MTATTAIILAGGFSSRMNRNNKALLKMGGESLIEIILNQVTVFDEILIVTNTPEDYAALGVRTITDIIPQMGPLSGIHSGLTHASNAYSIVVPCDMPFINSQLLLYLASQAEGYDAVVPKFEDKYQPLCSVYSKTCIDPIRFCLENDLRKITRFYSMIRIKEIPESELRGFGDPNAFFRNINDPQEYETFCLK
ncbi:MAG: mobA [Bacillota bacterium]|jgi:molybdopterin-guanine dinucleotide biosynthesis protein A|nr:mobA [Bacillota bacterium]